MAQNREGALENLRTTIEAMPEIKKCWRGYVNRKGVPRSQFPFAAIVNPIDTKPEEGMEFQIIITPQIQVHFFGYSASEFETLYMKVVKAILEDESRGGNATQTLIGDYDPLDYDPHLQLFTLDVRIFLTHVDLDQF